MEQDYDIDIYAIIGYIESEGLQKDFDLFIGDELEAMEYEKLYRQDKYNTIKKFVEEMRAGFEDVKFSVEESLHD